MDTDHADQPTELQRFLLSVCSRIDCDYTLSTIDTKKNEDDEKTFTRYGVTLALDNPNPCTMAMLACAIPRSEYFPVGLSRKNVVDTPSSITIKTQERTVIAHDATADGSGPKTVVPPYTIRIWEPGTIRIRFVDIPIGYMNSAPQNSGISAPGTLFCISARCMIGNILSRMAWLRKHTIEKDSVDEENKRVLYGMDMYYGTNQALVKRLVRHRGDTGGSLLPHKLKLRGITVAMLKNNIAAAYRDLSDAERLLYNTPSKVDDVSKAKEAVVQNLNTWANCYDIFSEGAYEWFPFRAAFDANRESKRHLVKPPKKVRRSPGDRHGNGGGDHMFYVAVEQTEDTAADKRQIYKVDIQINKPERFDGAFERIQDKERKGTKNLFSRLATYLKAIPDRGQLDKYEPVARNAALSTMRVHILLKPKAREMEALDQLFELSDQSEEFMTPYIDRLSQVGILDMCVTLAVLATKLPNMLHIPVETPNKPVPFNPTVRGAIDETARRSKALLKCIAYADQSYNDRIAVLDSSHPDDATVWTETTTDAAEWNVHITVHTMNILQRAGDQTNNYNVSPAREKDIQRVIYRAICRLMCSMNPATNENLSTRRDDTHPYGLYIKYKP
jgi:hypothetical protein